MHTWNRKAAALAAPVMLLLAATAHAEATIDGDVRVTVAKGKRFDVAVDVTMSNPGLVTLEGVVGGQPVSLSKKFKTKAGKSKSKTVKLKVDPKKLGVRDASDAIVFQFSVTAAEDGQAEPPMALSGASLPPPLMIVPGTGNELAPKGSYDGFRDALNESAGFPWLTKGKRASIKVQTYQSLSIGPIPLADLGAQIAKSAAKMIKKSNFSKCDIAAQSLGGLVVRQAMVPLDQGVGKKKKAVSLAGLVRHVFFMGVPQSGTPLAYMAQSAIQAGEAIGVDPQDLVGDLLGGIDNPSAAGLAELLLNKNFIGVVRTFLPTYEFAEIPIDANTTVRVDLPTLTEGADSPPLNDLNAIDPDGEATYHALYYTEVAGATGEVRTVVYLDLVGFLAGGGTDLAAVGLVNGEGDGVAPVTSTLMESHGNWAARLVPIALGEGIHSADSADGPPGFYNDPGAIGYILSVALAATAPPEVE